MKDWEKEIEENIKNIVSELEALGVKMTTTVVDAGSYDKESKHFVTLEKGNAKHEMTFTKGCGLRVWKNTACNPYRSTRFKFKRGQKVGYYGGRLSVYDAEMLEKMTEPEPVSIDEAVYSLLTDASCVMDGKSYEEFYDEFGGGRDAYRIYQACMDQWRGLVKLFNPAQIETLQEIYQDY